MLDIILTIAVFGAPILAVYAVMQRNKLQDKGHAGFIYDGKIWVSWLWVGSIIGTLYNAFIMPWATKGSWDPQWSMLNLIWMSTLLYVSYVMVSYRPATAEEIAEAKASGNGVIETTKEVAASALSGILTAVLASLASIPALLWNALNPVMAIKVIGGVTYKVIGTGFTSIVGGIVGLGILVIMVFMALYFASLIFSLAGTFALGILAVIKFVKNWKHIKGDK